MLASIASLAKPNAKPTSAKSLNKRNVSLNAQNASLKAVTTYAIPNVAVTVLSFLKPQRMIQKLFHNTF